MKHNGYFTFQTIIGAHGAFSDAVCVGSPVIIICDSIYKINRMGAKAKSEITPA